MAWDDIKIALDDFTSSDWNDMVTDQKSRAYVATSENKRGSNCSGSDGAKARVLTLANTSLSKSAGFKVFRNGALLHSTDLTISHLAASSTVTFTEINIFNTDYIYVEYFV